MVRLYWYLHEKLEKRRAMDEKGATMVEYSILIGLITAALIGLIQAVGPWLVTQWTTVATALGVAPAAP
jgi:pilus assembly protein Flp/PilA